MTVNALSFGSAGGVDAQTAEKTPQQEFLQLLVAQLENQDPLSPQDGAAFVAQLAQFTEVEQGAEANARLAEMYAAALDAVRDSGRPVVDRYGVEVTLGVLPPELLTLADPRELVGDATRLPEDVVDWQVYVHEEVVR